MKWIHSGGGRNSSLRFSLDLLKILGSLLQFTAIMILRRSAVYNAIYFYNVLFILNITNQRCMNFLVAIGYLQNTAKNYQEHLILFLAFCASPIYYQLHGYFSKNIL